jgi:hypothetical protein
VTSWAEVFLGMIAVATVLMALVQTGVIVCGWMLARRIGRLADQIEREIKPLVGNLNALSSDAARAVAQAAAHVERQAKLFGDLAARAEQTASTVQNVIVTPLRDGAAVLAGIRTAVAVFRNLTKKSPRRRARSEEEDALFIG